MKESQQIALEQAQFSQSGEPGIVRRGIGKGMDVAAGISKFTIWGFGGMWAAGEFAPGVVASAGLNPESVSTIGKWGTIFDAGTLLIDKFRKKDGGGSLSKQGNIFTRSAKSIGGELVAWPKTAGSQLSPLPKGA